MAKTRLSAETNAACVALLLAVLCAVNVYRAWTQSITYDEAVTYDAFVVGPMSHAFTGYNANNHVLFTVLPQNLWVDLTAKWSVATPWRG